MIHSGLFWVLWKEQKQRFTPRIDLFSLLQTSGMMPSTI
jgi:hypothetical protein